MITAIWIIIGVVVAVGFFLTTLAVVETQKQIRTAKARFRAANSSLGVMVSRPGLGWVPANETMRRY